MQTSAPASGKVGGLRENIAGAFAYFTFIPAVFFLARGPYNRSHFVRFHAAQCLLLWIAGLVVVALLRFAGWALFFLPLAGPFFVVMIYALGPLALFLIWLVLVVKAAQGETFGLPVLGALAEFYAVTA